MTSSNQLRACISAICRLPRTFHDGTERTLRQIYKESGYKRLRNDIAQSHIEGEIKKDRALIENWLRWSDKRWTPAWGLCQDNAGKWVVFHVEKGGRRICDIVCDDAIQACALMVRFEMEQLHDLATRRRSSRRQVS